MAKFGAGGDPIQRNSPPFSSFSEDLPARVVVREIDMNGVPLFMCFVQIDFGDTILEWRICPAMLAKDANWIEKKQNVSIEN